MTKKETEKWNRQIDSRLKPPKSFFDWCYTQIPTIRWSNKEKTIETEREHDVYINNRRLTKRTRLDFFDKFYSFAIVLVTTKRIEIQSYGFWSSYSNGKQSIKMKLCNFEKLANDQHIKLTEQFGHYVPGLTPNFTGSGAYSGTKFYPDGWKEKIKSISELKYLEFPNGLDYYNLPHMYKYRLEIEFLQKINANKMANDLAYDVTEYDSWHVRKAVDCRVITQKWLHQNKQFFKNTDRNFRDFELERRIKARGGKLVPGIEKLLTYQDINKIPKAAKMNRFQNWILKNGISFGYYVDYISMLDELGIVPDTDNLIMPKDLVKAHDNVVKLLIQKKSEIEQRKFEKRLKSLAKYDQTIGDYYFRAPFDSGELIREGKALSHCVGSARYTQDHASGKTTIIFIRKKSEPEQPFYTMEYKSGHIVQVRGKHNQSATEEVKKAVDQWLAIVNKKYKHA
ncbi:hypothetical protein GRB29_09220 [Streptococcus pneumoniae]|nr:hypothetical protein [Streptococcus pneumoniae]